MNGSLSRKAVVTTLGAAGLGLGLLVAASGSMPAALAQEDSTPAAEEIDVDVVEERGELRQELYADFTAALAAELGIASADEVDAAIRVALMSVIDARAAEGLLTAGQAEALKVLVATSDVPLGPAPMFAPPGAFIHRVHGEHEGRMVPGWEEGDRVVEREEGVRGRDGEERNSQADENEEASS